MHNKKYIDKIQKISMILINKEDIQQVGKVSFAEKSFDSVVKLVSSFFQCLKYAYVVYFVVFLYIVWFVCFYELRKRCVFRTLPNIQDGAFCENSQRLKIINYFHKGFIIDAWQGFEYISAEYKVNCLSKFFIC